MASAHPRGTEASAHPHGTEPAARHLAVLPAMAHALARPGRAAPVPVHPGAQVSVPGPEREQAQSPAPALDISGRPERVHVDGAARTRADSEEEERRAKRGIPGKTPDRAAPAKKTAVERPGRQRLTLSNALNEEQKERSLASLKRQRERQKLQALGAQQERVKI